MIAQDPELGSEAAARRPRAHQRRAGRGRRRRRRRSRRCRRPRRRRDAAAARRRAARWPLVGARDLAAVGGVGAGGARPGALRRGARHHRPRRALDVARRHAPSTSRSAPAARSTSTSCCPCCTARSARTARCRACWRSPAWRTSAPACSGAALTMDKDLTKAVLRDAGIAVAGSVTLRADEPREGMAERVATLGYPVFVKPARLGSSRRHLARGRRRRPGGRARPGLRARRQGAGRGAARGPRGGVRRSSARPARSRPPPSARS